jgi:hypothetical protein
MGETCKLAASLVSDVVGYSRLARADEDRILAGLAPVAALLRPRTVRCRHKGVSGSMSELGLRGVSKSFGSVEARTSERLRGSPASA